MVAHGGACVVVPRGGGMHGCCRGAWLLWGACVVALGGCVVAPGRGHAWLLWGGMHGCSWGACVVAPGGACVVALGGYAWLLPGAMRWIRRDTEIRSMSGQYASYWNAFLLYQENSSVSGRNNFSEDRDQFP